MDVVRRERNVHDGLVGAEQDLAPAVGSRRSTGACQAPAALSRVPPPRGRLLSKVKSLKTSANCALVATYPGFVKPRRLGASVADLKLADANRGWFAVFSAGVDPASIDASAAHHHRVDPGSPAVERKPVDTPLTDPDLELRAWFTRTEFYNDGIRPQDIADSASAKLFRDQTRFAMIYLAAPEHAEAFKTRSSELLAQLAPHLEWATRLTLKTADLNALHDAGLAALDWLNEGIVLADADARILFVNRAADAMLASGDGIGVDASGLRAARSAQTSVLRRLIALSTRQGDTANLGGSLLIERPSGRRPLSVIVAPMRRATAWRLAAPWR
jgi:hypothetical protein